MSRPINDTDKLDHQEWMQHHVERRVTRPDEEASEREGEAVVSRLMEGLEAWQHELLREHFAAENEEAMRDMQARMVGLLTKVVTFVCFPYAPAKLWGVVYALDLPLHNGRNMAETAARLGMSRAAISVHARDFLEVTGMPPSRWMRGEAAVVNSREARNQRLKDEG